ncbi:MAG: thioredoxin domain-containing protein, partial [Candidatus Caldarchaeum sp.]
MHKPNRLINERSPYLLQHAYNPVDWYPWGEEALRKAKEENKPIFLSIGYSSCHWCHVMEKESFEDEKIAELLNTYFVPVKVDREERPDIDEFYMKAVIMMTGHGGWPLTIFLTPDLKPFFGGTYFPPRRRGGLRGLDEILRGVAELWRKDPKQIMEAAEQNVSLLKSFYTTEKSVSTPSYNLVVT